jgi:hypothetical protein
MARPPAANVKPRDPSQLRIQQRHQVIQSLFVAASPSGDQGADVVWAVDHGENPTTKISLALTPSDVAVQVQVFWLH